MNELEELITVELNAEFPHHGIMFQPGQTIKVNKAMKNWLLKHHFISHEKPDKGDEPVY